ncbi:hypothetical protein C1645_733400 [Glomus cerebriforme]|uniref:Uncharacterized protein n=1 Tax=Glomus cerebriforme TaxID=658196 RepID=A0A397TI62_9GLOM|nr:hypothetical protein C1645_733400 [Glomus cerebriforme]
MELEREPTCKWEVSCINVTDRFWQYQKEVVKKAGLKYDNIYELLTYNTNEILKFTSDEIQKIMNHFSNKPNTDFSNNQDNSSSQTDVSKMQADTLISIKIISLAQKKWIPSNENFDYYGITDETLCPLCKLGHDNEESIEGLYEKKGI